MSRPRGSARLIGRIWVVALATCGFLLRQRTAGIPRLESVRSQVDDALANHPNVELRQALLALLGLAAALLSVVLLGIGVVAGLLTGQETWFTLGERASGASLDAALVAGARYLVTDRDRARWIAARRPEGWRASWWSIPGNRDLLYWLVVGGFLAYAMPENEICRGSSCALIP